MAYIPGAKIASEKFVDKEWSANATKLLQTHDLPPAAEGKATCRYCGWTANANDDGWNLDEIPPCGIG